VQSVLVVVAQETDGVLLVIDEGVAANESLAVITVEALLVPLLALVLVLLRAYDGRTVQCV